LMFKPLFITMLHSNYIVQDCSSCRDLYLVSHLVECCNMKNRNV
jgi:hypothetical protein